MRNKKIIALLLTMVILNIQAMANNIYLNNINQNMETIASYDNKMPVEVPYKEKFGKAPNVVDYIFVTSRIANLRENPDLESKIVGKYTYDSKLKLLKKIRYSGNIWYYVEGDNGERGYIAGTVSQKKTFRFQMAVNKVKELENFIDSSLDQGYKLSSTHSYVPNPNHENLSWDRDKYGTSIDQNLIGVSKNGEKIIIPDRSVLRIVEDKGSNVVIKALSIPEELEIPKSKLASNPIIEKGFKKVIAIDTENQNFMVFEKINNEWTLISYVYSKTGIESQLGFETPKGFFIVPTVKYVMAYNDENGQKQGAAKYATRFSGGGYIHGTPINVQEEVNREFFSKQKEFTLGTTSGTRKCVRTTEEHAKFLFDWIVKNPDHNSNEQRPAEDVYVLVF